MSLATTRMRPDGPLWGRLWPAFPASLAAPPFALGFASAVVQGPSSGLIVTWSGVVLAAVSVATWAVGHAVARHPLSRDFGSIAGNEQAYRLCRLLAGTELEFMIPDVWDNLARSARDRQWPSYRDLVREVDAAIEESQRRSPSRAAVDEYVEHVRQLRAKLAEDPKQLP